MDKDDLEKEVSDLKDEVERIGSRQNDLFHRLQTAAGYLSKISPSATIREIVNLLRRAASHIQGLGKGDKDD